MGLFKRTALAVLTAAPAAAAQAGDGALQPGWYFASMYSHTRADEARLTGDGAGFALSVGHRGDFGSLELSGVHTALDDGRNGEAADLTGGSLSLLVAPRFGGVMSRLYGLIGFGAFRRDNHPQYPQDDTTIFGDAGGGYLHPFTLFGIDLAARAEARYRYDVQQPPHPAGVEHAYGDIVFNLGLQMPLSESTAAPPAPDESVAVVTPVAVGTDADRDGVSDDLDQCPGTQPEMKVDETGCAVSILEQAIAGRAVLNGVHFELASDVLTDASMAVLDGVARDLIARSELKVEVGGHTDSSGEEFYNGGLSQRRAESVRHYLVQKGVDAARMTAAGYGETQPVADNGTAEGRAKNRRVEMKVLK